MKRVHRWPLPHAPNPNPPVAPLEARDSITWEERSYAVIDRLRVGHAHGRVKNKVRKRTTKVSKPRRGLIR